jgi:hypothetical protein
MMSQGLFFFIVNMGQSPSASGKPATAAIKLQGDANIKSTRPTKHKQIGHEG